MILSQSKPKYSLEEVILTFKTAWEAGADLRISRVATGPLAPIYRSGLRYFDSWEDVLAAANISIDDVTAKAEEEKNKKKVEGIIAEIQREWEEGTDLRFNGIETVNRSLFRRACYNFGGWKEALKAAGLDYKEVKEKVEGPRKEKDRIRLLEEISEAYQQGVDLSSFNLQNSSELRTFYDRSKRFYKGKFGWENTLKAAGLPVDKIVKQRRWDKKRVIRKLKERHELGEKINSHAVSKSDFSLFKAITNYFDNYNQALDAAGLELEVRQSNYFVKNSSLSVVDIIEEITILREAGVNLTLTNIIKNDDLGIRSLFYSASRKFSGWYGALEAAGVNPDDYRKRKPRGYWTEESVSKHIKSLAQNGLPLNAGAAEAAVPGLIKAGARIHGSWDKTLEFNGLNPGEIRLIRASRSLDEIVRMIQTLYRDGVSLSPSDLMNDSDSSLKTFYHTSATRFGSWRKAVEASGIDYFSIVKSRTYTLMDANRIVKDLEVSGFDLSVPSIKSIPHGHGLYKYVLKRFDSWNKFLEQAGIDVIPYITRIDWNGGEGVIDYLRENYPTGVVFKGVSHDKNFAFAVRKYFGTVGEAVKAAKMVYSSRGRIRHEQLDDARIISNLYDMNKDYLEEIASKIFWGAYNFKGRSLPVEDLVNEAFVHFIKLLPEKPAKMGVREFCYKPLRAHLLKLNADSNRETLFEEDVYFDLFMEDRDLFDESNDPANLI